MKNELNSLIMQAMKEHNTTRTETLRAIKTAFMNWETSKEHNIHIEDGRYSKEVGINNIIFKK